MSETEELRRCAVCRRFHAPGRCRITKKFKALAAIAEKAFASVVTDDDVPVLVERVRVEQEQHDGRSYEEANWAKLSPMFREAHNRLRVARGMSPIPPPKIDRWIPPKMRGKPMDMSGKEFTGAMREFMGGGLMGGGGEGFENRGKGKADWGE